MIVATGVLAPDEEGFRAVDTAHDHAAGAGVLAVPRLMRGGSHG